MKKIYIMFILMVATLLPNQINVLAEEEYTLIHESYSVGGTIVRYYESESGEVLTVTINIPDEIVKTINESENPLLEAKKQLTSIYINLNLKNRLAELNNQKLPRNYIAKITIDQSIKNKFLEEQKMAYEFAQSKKAEYDNLTKEEKKDYYQESENILPYEELYDLELDMSEGGDPNKPNSEENSKIEKEKNDEKESSKDESSNWMLYIGISFVLVFIFVLMYLVKRKG